MKTVKVCRGKIDPANGICNECFQPAQTTSSDCGRLIEEYPLSLGDISQSEIIGSNNSFSDEVKEAIRNLPDSGSRVFDTGNVDPFIKGSNNSEPVNSSIKLDPIRTVDEMQEVVNEGNSSMSEKEEKKDKIQLGALVYVLKDHDLREIFIDNNKELIEELRKVLGEPVVSQDQPLTYESYLKLIGADIHNATARVIWNALEQNCNPITRKPID